MLIIILDIIQIQGVRKNWGHTLGSWILIHESGQNGHDKHGSKNH